MSYDRWDQTFARTTFAGKNVLITGGGTGIGKLLAQLFGRYGANIVIASRKEDVLQQAQKEILAEMRAAGQTTTVCIYKKCDIRREDDVKEMAEFAFKELGRIDILINNSGANFLSPAKDISPNGWRTVIDICLNGTFLVSKYIGEKMIQSGHGGCIIMNAGTNAHGGSPMIAHSGAGKAGMISLAETLAAEWGRYNIRVNSVSPGAVITPGSSARLWDNLRQALGEDMGKNVPLGRFAGPEDIVGPILFLASPAAAFVTGSNFVVDGGQRLQNSFLKSIDVQESLLIINHPNITQLGEVVSVE